MYYPGSITGFRGVLYGAALHFRAPFQRPVQGGVVGIIGAAVIFFAKTALCWQGAVIFALVVFVRWKWAKLNPIWSLAASAFLGWVLFLV